MWKGTRKGGGGGGGNGLIAVAIDKDKGSQNAIRWAADTLLTRGQTVILIHVSHALSSSNNSFIHSFLIFFFSSFIYNFKKNAFSPNCRR